MDALASSSRPVSNACLGHVADADHCCLLPIHRHNTQHVYHMYILVAYDVSTSSPDGEKRLRHVAKTCLDYGQRVQNSVFECKIDPARYVAFKQRLLEIIDPDRDSLRFYNLGNNWKKRVEHYGAQSGFDIEGLLVVE